MSKQVDLYQYQEQASDCLVEAVLDNDIEVKVSGPKLVRKTRCFTLTSPLGSGKTRIGVRVAKLVSESEFFNQKVYSFDIGSQNSVLKSNPKSKFFIIVPVSVVPHWQKELELWSINYYAIITPKNIKPISEIEENIILVTDYRTKDIKRDFFDEENQYYLMIDEYDTCIINKTFTEMLLGYVKSKLSISANYDGNDYYSLPYDIVDNCRVIISEEAVKRNIQLPPPIEIILKFSIYPILVENFKNFSKDIVDNIRDGNLRFLFTRYCLGHDSTIDKFFSRIINEKQEAIKDHCKKVQVMSDAYTQKLEDQCDDLKKSLIKYQSVCAQCVTKISSPRDSNNCLTCYNFYCNICYKEFFNNSCKACVDVNSGVSIPGDGTSYIFKNRIQSFQKILQNIKERRGSVKKVLIYCSHPDLVSILNGYLEKNNYWSFPLEGSSASRIEKLKKFKLVDTDIYLVCNSVQNSAGIHLPEATDIIIFHELEDKYDTQVVGRAQRIGRKESLHLHRIQEYSS